MGKKALWLALLVLPAAALYLLASVYAEVRQKSIRQWDAPQTTLASQVAKGVEGLFRQYQNSLTYLSRDEHVVRLDDNGRRMLASFQQYNRDTVKAVTRLDETGRVLFTFPHVPAMIGRDLSGQEHNAQVMATHLPVVSEVFQAVQGYPAVAYAMPIFAGGAYNGVLSLLIPFETIAASYLRDIRLGQGEHAWVVSRRGQLIFQSPGGIQASDLQEPGACASLLELASLMAEGGQGARNFLCGRPAGEPELRQRAVYYPVELGNTHWSVAIAAPEEEILGVMRGLVLRWLVITATILAAWLLVSYYVVKTWAVLEETRKRRLAEEALKESEEKLRLLFAYSLDGVMLTTPDGQILAANPAACRLLGYSEDELKALPPGVTLAADSARVEPARRERDRTGAFRGELTFRCKDGTEVEMDVSSNLFQDRQGRYLATTILRDLTQAKKAARERAQLEASLRRTQHMQSLGALAGGIAHDFNNVLGAIMGYAELARSHLRPEQTARSDLEQVLKASQRAKEMVKQILSFSAQGEQELKPLRLAPIVKETLNLLKASLPRGIVLESRLEEGGGTVLADATKMHQVLMNLFTNALHAMNGGAGVLEVTLRRVEPGPEEAALGEKLAPGQYVLLSVRDTGQGMEPETLERIFEPYFTTKGQGKGTGLGLAVVHGIVKSHGGAIAVKSEPGRGTVFLIWLPLRGQTPAAEEEAAPSGPLPGGQESVLLVEDEYELAQATRRELEGLGYRVLAVQDGEQALAALAAGTAGYDLLLTDLMLPGMSGTEIIERARRLRPDLPAVVCTGYSRAEEIARLQALGVEYVLMKPVPVRQLAETVRQVLDGARPGPA